MQTIFKRIIYGIYWRYIKWVKIPVYRFFIPCKVNSLRSKEKIDVLFIVTEIGPWKTKMLYEAMLRHHRFNPIIGISESREVPDAKQKLIDFLRKQDIEYVDLDYSNCDIFHNASPDIIFYEKPYDGVYRKELVYWKHLKSLFCYVYYALRTNDVSWSINLPIFSCLWQQYFENKLVASPLRLSLMNDKGKQAVVTGLPIQDQLMIPKEKFVDPWKKQDYPKKRIIYAPHHTIGNEHLSGLALSSFMENGEIMLELMHKYKDKVQWAFKPHPLLYSKLIKIWGQEKTDRYYDEWKKAENSQYENGEYDALFKYSDAMIHDCSSFTIEYHYTKNPVMYLIRQQGLESSYNEFGQKAFDLHYKGHTKEDIEQFIQNVIDGIDPMKEEREKFYNEHLIPPYGKTACQNIINAILGEEEYKDK